MTCEECGRDRPVCAQCRRCSSCECECLETALFDADELGLDPEEDDTRWQS